MINKTQLSNFYKNKKVLVTGHTGFKGSWMCMVLDMLGAKVCGYSLEPPTFPSLFECLGLDKSITSIETIDGSENAPSLQSIIGDIRDLDYMQKVFAAFKPEIVIHMAAQPIVRESYKDPVGTYSSNVMGTVNLLECVRQDMLVAGNIKSVVNVTTDKVYRNNEWDRGYVETDFLDGYDPYSNSKSCSELVTHSYIQSFFEAPGACEDGAPIVRVSTCRAGNVIGGGDFAADRIIPDSIRAAGKSEDIIVRNPYSTRPYEHVLEPLYVYLMIAMKQWQDNTYSSSYNVGPDDESCVTTGNLVDMFVEKWNSTIDKTEAGTEFAHIKWINKHDGGPHEAGFLKLDCTKLKNTFDWHPVWNINTTMDKLIEWYYVYLTGGDVVSFSKQQIEEFLNLI